MTPDTLPHVPTPPSSTSDKESDNDNTSTATAKPEPESAESSSRTSITLSAQLNQECNDLLSQLDSYQSLLASTLRNPQLVEVRQFRSSVVSELRMLEKLGRQIEEAIGETSAGPETSQTEDGVTTQPLPKESRDPDLEMRLVHALRSSNLPFYQAVWRIASGSCSGLVALGKRFYWGGETKATERKGASGKGKAGGVEKQPNKDKRKSVFVDIVADDGEEWVKVSTMSESRLLFEMAKKGWEGDSDEDEWSDGGKGRTILQNFDEDDDGDDDDELELIKLAQDLRKASDATRVRYRHPRLRVVIPKIEEGSVPEIDAVLNEMRSYGIRVDCQGSLLAETRTGLAHLLPQPFKNFTSTLNVDCTLLLALVSDLSHVKDIPLSPHFHRAIVRQIEVEREKPLLASELWPAMDGRELLSTTEAAVRFREIVETIGTETEKSRTRMLLGDPPYEQLDCEALLQKFQELSDYQVPAHWKLPIKVVESQQAIDAAKAQGNLHPVVHEVGKDLSDINHSVFLYGWVTRLTTISSNRTIDKQIEATVEDNRKGDDGLEGPDVWICDTARSLVGKDKDRKA
ncbi:DNA methylase, N-6 adenine-specific, conserved site [Penicillium camemberti]|uniref:DNA methylase, N-6 adenine-specific, conserved site n=1 Tax=Penicillium camemberti (strain FM 013) TaxID=1429867 RepID=A0A0G4PHI0_PENC3|nr:DNA methylase, N-6 adenine-specific, conserved site [Penicillium camemberti]